MLLSNNFLHYLGNSIEHACFRQPYLSFPSQIPLQTFFSMAFMSLTNSAKFSLGFSTELRWDWGGGGVATQDMCLERISTSIAKTNAIKMFYYVISASNFSGTTFFLATLLQVVPAYHKASLQLYFTICVCTRIAHCPIWTTIRQSQFVSHRNSA